MRGQKTAFTLAEVLITLAVIGIVAALTIGIFLPKIHSTIRARQIATAEVKFTKAMEQMALNNAVGPYYDTTQEFVDELQNYLKVSKVCANGKLEDCFGYEKIKLNNGEEYELSEITDGKILGKNSSYKETVGIVTIDGTAMILSWNKDCPILEPKVYPWAGNTNETTSCVAMVMDVNLDKSPNAQNKDIATMNARLGCGVKFEYGGTKYCWDEPFAPTPLTDADCAANGSSKYGISECIDSSYSNQDYWGDAMKQCKSEGKHLPTQADLKALAQYLYDTQNINDSGDTSGLTINTSKLNNLPSEILSSYQTNGRFILWSGVEASELRASNRIFYPTETSYGNGSRYFSPRLGVCVP